MFWGLIMEPSKRYTQIIKKAFHVSMASLDVSNSDGYPAQVMCGYEGRNYLLCTLQKDSILQAPLDLHFEEGTTVSFATNGKSHIHLTGYLTKDLDETSDEEIDEEPQKFNVQAQKKPRTVTDKDSQPSPKKMKKEQLVEEEEDDSDDSDVDLDKLMNASDAEELSEEESGDEEESNLDEDGVEEEEDDGDVEEIEDVEEEEEVKVEPAVNGLGKKSKKVKMDQGTPKQDKQGKEKPTFKLTPGPKQKKNENDNLEVSPAKEKGGKKTKENKTPISKKTLPGGVIIEDLKEGQGGVAANGKFIHVYYEGRLKTNNKVFDRANNGPGFGFRLGKGEVIKGWDIGVSGMKVGGKRRITCPPHLAYGAKGSPPVIPGNSTLVFEVELKKVK